MPSRHQAKAQILGGGLPQDGRGDVGIRFVGAIAGGTEPQEEAAVLQGKDVAEGLLQPLSPIGTPALSLCHGGQVQDALGVTMQQNFVAADADGQIIFCRQMVPVLIIQGAKGKIL